MLRLKNIYGGYNKGNPVLKGINLSIGKNEVVAIVGQNGAGKSTMAKAILNMLPYQTGNVYFDGIAINDKSTVEIINKGIGYYMQGGRIFPHLSIGENLLFAGAGLKKAEYHKNFDEIKEHFEIFNNNYNGRARLQASLLSGGERAQLALAMVLLRKPAFLILDEPSAGLSPANINMLYNILNKIKEAMNLSILLIEQNVHFAHENSDKMLLIQDGLVQTHELEIDEIEKRYFSV